ncbi:MAG: tetratricopeptide repeat protein [Deltaproteobacteria bacterium]|nr:tetratricopeptide repeat protein [Deltaproteobacteria bacterium]
MSKYGSTRGPLKRALLLFSCLLLLTPALAPAQPKRPSPKKEAKLGQKKDAGLDDSLKEELKRQKSDENWEAAPTLKFEQFKRGVELQLAEKRREQIETLSKIVELGQGGSDIADLLFRLAELYWEEAQYYFFLSNQKDDEIIAAGGDQQKIAQLKAEQLELNDQSNYYRRQAVQRYREIVQGYRDYPRLDEVLYSLGSNLWEQGEQQAALKAYKALVQRFKQSEYVPDAFLAFGEYYFNKGEIRKALKAYESASAFTESKVYGFAMYKQGWCYYNLGDYAKALDLFKAVIYYSDIAASVTGENKIALVREARRDYVLAYSQVGNPKEAKTDFDAIGGDNADKMIRSLANLYYDTGKDKEAIYVYRLLIKEQPLHPDSPGYQARIVDAAQRIGNKRYTVKQARLLTRLFREVEEAKVIKTDKEKEKMADAMEFAERTIRTLAVTWHSEAKKTRDEDVYFLAHELYADYLNLFPSTKHEYKMRFYFAELLYYLEKFPEAAEQYTRTVLIDIDRIEGKRKNEKGEPEKPGKFMIDATFNAILSYEDVAKKFEETEQRPSVPSTTKIDIPPPKQALLEACERYHKYVPRGDKVVEITYKIANIYYRYNHFDEAVQRFAWVALEHPENDMAEYAANLVLDSYVLLDNPEKVNGWARKFLKNDQLAKGKFRTDLLQIIEDSALTMVERSSKDGKHAVAAKSYEGFVAEFPKSKKADRALFNASVSWAKANRLDRALALRARIIQEYPDSKLVPESIFSTAKGYESFAAFDQAARFYELYANRYKEQKEGPPASAKGKGKGKGKAKPAAPKSDAKYEEGKAQEALFNAAVLREGLGQFAKARADRETYIALWPKATDAEALYLTIADLHEREGNIPAANAQLEGYLKTYKAGDIDENLVMRLRMARLYEKSKNTKLRAKADQKYDEIRRYYAGLKKRKSEVKAGLEAVATVELMDLKRVREDYDKAKLVYPWTEKQTPKELFAFIAEENLQKLAAKLRTERDVVRLKKRIKDTAEALKAGVSKSDAAFKKSASAKADELKKVVEAYTKIVKYKQGEPALCALEKIGLVYLDYVQVLKKAPAPPYLQDEGQELQFRDNLAQEMLPIEDKAIEAFSTAVQKSHELHIYNACSRRALKQLRKLRPDQWPLIVEKAPPVTVKPVVHATGEGYVEAIQPIPAPEPEGQAERPDSDIAGDLPGEEVPARAPEEVAGAGPEDTPKPRGKKSLDEIYSDPEEDEDLLP